MKTTISKPGKTKSYFSLLFGRTNLFEQFLIALIVICSITSCSVEKRHYRKGYHITWQHPPVQKIKTREAVPEVNKPLAAFKQSTERRVVERIPQHINSTLAVSRIEKKNDAAFELSAGERLIASASPNLKANNVSAVSDIHPSSITTRTFKKLDTTPAPKKKTSPFAVASLLCLAGFAFGLPILSIFLGIAGLIQVSANPEKYEGEGLAILGFLLGIIYCIIMVSLMVAAFNATLPLMVGSIFI